MRMLRRLRLLRKGGVGMLHRRSERGVKGSLNHILELLGKLLLRWILERVWEMVVERI